MSKRQPPADVYIQKKRKTTTKIGFIHIKSLETPFISSTTNSPTNFLCLRSDRLYTIGRKFRCCNLIFDDPRVSKRHCQIFFDALSHKVFILDGYFSHFMSNFSDIATRVEAVSVRPSLNGVYVNGDRIGEGKFVELVVGDEVQFVCANEFDLSFNVKIGFVVERIVYSEEVVRYSLGDFETNKVSFERGKEVGKGKVVCTSSCDERNSLAVILLGKCKKILSSVDPISYFVHCIDFKGKGDTLCYRVRDAEQNVTCQTTSNVVTCKAALRKHIDLSSKVNVDYVCTPDLTPPKRDCGETTIKNVIGLCRDHEEGVDVRDNSVSSKREEILRVSDVVEIPSCRPLLDAEQNVAPQTISNVAMCEFTLRKHIDLPSKENDDSVCTHHLTPPKRDCHETTLQNDIGLRKYKEGVELRDTGKILRVSPGKKFYLNRLCSKVNRSSDQHMVVSLPELLHPVESLTRMFIATFTSDILWFLSYCSVPNNLPVTIACHNIERCWSASTEKRISTPYDQFPNLSVIFPPFPDVIAFGQDRKKQGIACHHPKLLVLQREEIIRVVITSANLVSKQWNDVTNTVWWQDFPLRSVPDFSALFASSDEEPFEGFKSDFASQLAGFMASLVVDIPSQAHWITELSKYDFEGANGHLVASVPGMHKHITPYPSESMYFLSGNHCASELVGMKFIGSVEASLVGLKYRFHTVADSNGAALKTLAAFVGKCRENAFGMSEVVLRRNHNIPADANAVSVLICDLDDFAEGDYIQLGFLPRNTAKWVASLSDAGFFSFSAYIYPKEVLSAALEGSNNQVQLLLYVSQGPQFSEISSLLQPEHIASISSLIASLQRCVGLSRLHEVLSRYKWPELLETDFVYGSSSIGTSVSSQFLAAFSSAAGKRVGLFSESEESDPEWGRWTASEELRKPSMSIIFPTIERVKSSSCGIWPSRRLLCLSEGTWQRLRPAGIFHDAVPHPICRVGYPMHSKVARRRFQRKTSASSFGWVYSGSHNFSAAAWGRQISPSSSRAGVAEKHYSQGPRLHISNYELGIIFLVPPSTGEKVENLDDITLPFVMPSPKYRPYDRPATKKAMRDAVSELVVLKKSADIEQETVEEMVDEIPDEEELPEVIEYVVEEKEEEKAYAEALWSQVDSAEN